MYPPRPISRNAPSSCARSPGAGRLIRFRSYLNVGRGISKGDVSPPWIIFLPTFWIMPKSRGRRGLSGEEERESFNPQSSTAPQAKRKRFSRTESPPGSRVNPPRAHPLFLEATQLKTVRTVIVALRTEPVGVEAQAVGIDTRNGRRTNIPAMADVIQLATDSRTCVAEARGRAARHSNRAVSTLNKSRAPGEILPFQLIVETEYFLLRRGAHPSGVLLTSGCKHLRLPCAGGG